MPQRPPFDIQLHKYTNQIPSKAEERRTSGPTALGLDGNKSLGALSLGIDDKDAFLQIERRAGGNRSFKNKPSGEDTGFIKRVSCLCFS